jgi:hypothetical protein
VNVRFADDALRVRLSAADVDALRAHAAVRCTVRLPAGFAMQVTVRRTDLDVPGISHTSDHHAMALHVTVPGRELERWGDVHGRERTVQQQMEVQIAASAPLTLTIEQDLHPKTERL